MTNEQKLIKSKMNLLDLSGVMGYSRDAFYRVKKAYEEGGMEALKEKSRRKPNIKNRVSEEVEEAVVALKEPAFGQKRASGTLRKRGVFTSPAGVRCVRHGLKTFAKRLKRLEEHRGSAYRIPASCNGEGKRREDRSRKDRN